MKKNTKKKKKNQKKKKFSLHEENTLFSLLEVIIIIILSILFGIVIGYFIMIHKDEKIMNPHLKEVVNTYQNIVDQYYDEVDQKDLSSYAIKGMVESLGDQYSSYMDQSTTVEFHDKVDGSFVGIGVRVFYEGEYNRIVEVMKNTPAEKEGLQVDDVILEVDGKDVKGLYHENISNLIRGKENTKVKITVLRKEKKKTFTITRKSIELESVTSTIFEVEDNTVGYIQMESFSSNTYSQFLKILKDLEKQSITSLIIDVRNNPGGSLSQTREILDLFFSKNTVLYQTETKKEMEKVKAKTKEKREYPIQILINESSASASEILASCFQENYKKSTIIGSKSYGKGSVQKTIPLSNGTSIKYTTQKWLTSKGKWLNEVGVTPDIEVEQKEEYYENPTYENDIVLQKALDQIKES